MANAGQCEDEEAEDQMGDGSVALETQVVVDDAVGERVESAAMQLGHGAAPELLESGCGAIVGEQARPELSRGGAEADGEEGE